MSKALAKRGSGKGGNFNITKGDGVGAIALGTAEFGGHALFAIASKNMESIGPVPVRPDVAGIGLAGLMMVGVFGKKGKKLGKALGKGALHAVISRFAYQGPGDIFAVKGPATTTEGKAEPKFAVNIDARGVAKDVVDTVTGRDEEEEAA